MAPSHYLTHVGLSQKGYCSIHLSSILCKKLKILITKICWEMTSPRGQWVNKCCPNCRPCVECVGFQFVQWDNKRWGAGHQWRQPGWRLDQVLWQEDEAGLESSTGPWKNIGYGKSCVYLCCFDTHFFIKRWWLCQHTVSMCYIFPHKSSENWRSICESVNVKHCKRRHKMQKIF